MVFNYDFWSFDFKKHLLYFSSPLKWRLLARTNFFILLSPSLSFNNLRREFFLICPINLLRGPKVGTRGNFIKVRAEHSAWYLPSFTNVGFTITVAIQDPHYERLPYSLLALLWTLKWQDMEIHCLIFSPQVSSCLDLLEGGEVPISAAYFTLGTMAEQPSF